MRAIVATLGLIMCAALPAQAQDPASDVIEVRSVPVANQAYVFDPIVQGRPDDEAAAHLFASSFQAQVKAQSWLAVESLAPLYKAFQGSQALTTPEFRAAWTQWERQRLFNGWVADDDGRGLWKMEDAPQGRRPQTLGVRQQPNGQWWLILVRTQDAPGQAGWNCSPSCNIRVSAAGRPWQMSAKPPLQHSYRTSDAVGAPVPLSLLVDAPHQFWEFQLPGTDEIARFDLSWWPSLCRQKLGICPVLPSTPKP